jgi:hypothetical protein
VASRQQEKERRRRERLEREAAEARAKARRARLQWVGGGALAVALVAAVVVALVLGLGGSDEGGARTANVSGEQAAQLPAQRITDLTEAAEASGCEVVNARYEGAGHSSREFQASDYETNPPTSGDHNPEWYDDGVYEADAIPRLGMLVHTLEHGRINVQYRPGTPQATIDQLEALLQESNEGYHMLLYPNTTDMPYAVSATAWTHALNCKQMNNRVFDAIRAFRTRWIDRGPERVP